MKSNSSVRPDTFQDLGNGCYHYNFNITEVELIDEDRQKRISYNFDVVEIWGLPSYEQCVKAVIAALYDYAAEIALINKYQAFALGLDEDTAARDEYLQYLQYVRSVKQQVKQDLSID